MKTSPRLRPQLSSDQSGHALLLSAIIGTLAFALWLVAFRSTNDAKGYQDAAPSRAIHLEAMPAAMAKAGRLLKTGSPSSLPYHCIYQHYVAPGEWQDLLIQFQRGGGSNKFSVEVTLASSSESKRYPIAPNSF